ncbi:MAG: hypothetical protein GY864_07500 [Desulfobacterales bacterium]|nr:hypothetical protein [Desulfobacterales bacterium]
MKDSPKAQINIKIAERSDIVTTRRNMIYFKELPAILFPHTQIKDTDLEKIGTLFGRLTICQPWFMEAPISANGENDSSFVHLVQAPASLKPKEDFRKILSEYQMWIGQGRDKGLAAFFEADKEMGPSDHTAWEIRRMINRAGEDPDASLDDNILKWHLILCLAREFEESRVEAEEMFDQLKGQKSPLEGSLENDASSKGFLEDLNPFEAQLLMDEHHLRQIFEAWFGLFGESIPDNASLITLDRNVMDYATGLFEDYTAGPVIGMGVTDNQEPALTRTRHSIGPFPLFSSDSNGEIDLVLSGLSNKTIILMED